VTDFEHEDELYYYLQTQGDLKPLVVATYDGKDWPVLWTRNYGRGKVGVSVFGHCGWKPKDKDPLDHAPFRRLILQGIAWTAGRDLKVAAKP
jgi:type 1 glutamine amidotransferase